MTGLWTFQTFHCGIQYFRVDEYIQLPQREKNQGRTQHFRGFWLNLSKN